MQNNAIFEELKSYGEKFGAILGELSQLESISEEGYSEREVILQDNKLTLYHYLDGDKQAAEEKISTPVLIVYALVNRPTILDLEEKRSAIAKMLEYGLDVYLIDWGYPDKSDSHLDLNDYINDQLYGCVTNICEKHSIDSINILGVCQGGALSLCYSSMHPKTVKNLITIVTPVDFHTENDTLSLWVRHIDVDLMVDTLGNIPGNLLSNTFLSLKPYQLQLKKYFDLVESTIVDGDNANRISNFLLMERWIFDSPDQAGEAFRHFVKFCYQQNQLIGGELEIDGKQIDLSKLQMPILNVYAQQDHLVPPDASRALKDIVAMDDYNEMSVAGGHIGIFVSPKSIEKIFPAVAHWLEKRD